MNKRYANHILEQATLVYESGHTLHAIECNPVVAVLIRPYLRPECAILENSRFYGGVYHFYTKPVCSSNKRKLWFTWLNNTLKKFYPGIFNG